MKLIRNLNCNLNASDKVIRNLPAGAANIIGELDLKEAEKIAAKVKATVETHCELIEVAGIIRRQKPSVCMISTLLWSQKVMRIGRR
jgi:hypothetical protein